MTATALHETLAASGARLAEYNGAQTASVFSSPEQEFAALRQRCGMFDLGWRAKLAVSGKDRVRWMNGMVSNNIRDLAPGRGVYSFLLTAQGHILGDMYVYNRGESLLVDTGLKQLPNLVATFKKYIIMDKVELSEAGDKLAAIGLHGPGCQDVLSAAGIPQTQLESLQFTDVKWQGTSVTLVRTRFGGYEIWLPAETISHAWSSFTGAGAIPVGSEALEMWRVAQGIPEYGRDIRERDLPQETGQDAALNFTKGCYIGQEIVERIRSRGAVHRSLTGFIFAGSPPPPSGAKIEKDGREIGEITSTTVVPAPSGQMALGLGYLRQEAGGPGTRLQIGGLEATVAKPPFDL